MEAASERPTMILCLLMLSAVAEGFLLWFLVVLMRERRCSARHALKSDPAQRGSMRRSELLHEPQTWMPDLHAGKNRFKLAIRVKF
jgi:hypothetical protein